jgi:hypothetical protein
MCHFDNIHDVLNWRAFVRFSYNCSCKLTWFITKNRLSPKNYHDMSLVKSVPYISLIRLIHSLSVYACSHLAWYITIIQWILCVMLIPVVLLLLLRTRIGCWFNVFFLIFQNVFPFSSTSFKVFPLALLFLFVVLHGCVEFYYLCLVLQVLLNYYVIISIFLFFILSVSFRWLLLLIRYSTRRFFIVVIIFPIMFSHR